MASEAINSDLKVKFKIVIGVVDWSYLFHFILVASLLQLAHRYPKGYLLIRIAILVLV